ncbi:hypothetical protein [uncultured Ralstonia sp.]|jgi:hypothetical protein|uniref:hypothetical protein n=1 Tax=uncultured Ralstonia sp. TaxID=114715 RepID=UPI0025DA884A|nr:hypothetical protein [uncultured Ralstonia sp.]
MKLDHYFMGKRILFIGPRTFGYEREITTRLQQLGAIVEYHDDRPSAKASMKVAIRLFPTLVERQIRGYFESILAHAQDDFDFVFIIKLECMPLDILAKLRQKLARARFIYYSWDSVRNNRNFEGAASYFDRLFTFDTEDAKADACLKLRPLFFLNEYRNLPHPPSAYDLCFVGTVHSDRFTLIKKVKALIEQSGARTKFYMFVPHKLIYWANRVFSRAFWGSRPSDFAFEPLKKADVLQMIAQSRAILDIQHPGQTGLTMRTIEMLGARKKLITTNPLVRGYEFFRPENILVIDRGDPVIDPGFLGVPYVELPEDLYERYSLDGWIREVFSVPACVVE